MGINRLLRLINLLMVVIFILLVQVVVIALMIFDIPIIQKESNTIKMNRNTAKVRMDKPANNIVDPYSVLKADENLPIVVGNCTGCHSAKLIVQNRATREGWEDLIRWMQKTQNLWDLGINEDLILDYLAKHYAPEKIGRRKNLENIVWYDFKEGNLK